MKTSSSATALVPHLIFILNLVVHEPVLPAEFGGKGGPGPPLCLQQHLMKRQRWRGEEMSYHFLIFMGCFNCISSFQLPSHYLGGNPRGVLPLHA